MSALHAQLAPEIAAACRANAAEIAAALGRALEGAWELAVGEPGSLSDPLAEMQQAGLGLWFQVDQAGAALLLADATGKLPNWLANPDATGQSKLTTLAQELGMLVLPETLMAADFRAALLPNLRDAFHRGGFEAPWAHVPLRLTLAGTTLTALLVWPGTQMQAFFTPAAAESARPAESPSPGPAPQAQTGAPPPAGSGQPHAPGGARLAAAVPRPHPASVKTLPPYTRSLLQIKVPVSVTLATRRQPVKQVLEIGVGTLIQFDRSCDELLELRVGEEEIALGEAVKVGDKFGLRIVQMRLPDERFTPVRRR